MRASEDLRSRKTYRGYANAAPQIRTCYYYPLGRTCLATSISLAIFPLPPPPPPPPPPEQPQPHPHDAAARSAAEKSTRARRGWMNLLRSSGNVTLSAILSPPFRFRMSRLFFWSRALLAPGSSGSPSKSEDLRAFRTGVREGNYELDRAINLFERWRNESIGFFCHGITCHKP